MAEQTINYGYGEAMFKDIKPKEVLAGVKDAAVSWWNEFSPETMGREHVEAFDRVASRVKNEDLRKFFQDKKELVRWAGMVRGTGTLVIDATLATIPWYLKLRNWVDVDRPKIEAEARKGASDRVLESRMQNEAKSYEGEFAMWEAQDRALEKRPWYRKLLDPFGEDRDAKPFLEKGAKQARKILEGLVAEDIKADKGKSFKAEIKKDVKGRIRSKERGFGAKMVGLAGVEAGVFAFRPATRLAKLQTRVGEAAGSWVVDHIVNNIVKGPSAEPAKIDTTPAR